jgi:hypothetical protein
VALYWVTWTSLSPLSYHNGFKDSKINKQGTAGKRKHVTLTAPQKLWINEAWKRQKPKRGSSFTQQWATSYIRYGKLERPIIFIYGIKWKCDRPFKCDRQRKSLISTTGQGVVKWVYSNIFQRKTHD